MGVPLLASLREDRRAVAPAGPASRRIWAGLCESALAELWDSALRELAKGPVAGVALAAVGSLGRGDCGPESDLDLVLLHDGAEHPEIHGGIAALAQALWYPLWDSHVPIDHSVRSLAECRGIARRDLFASCALLDVRCVAGDGKLVDEASAALHSDWRAGVRLRFPEIERDRDERIARAGELAYEIEGDVKEAAGGLRDGVVLRAIVASWLAERPAVDYLPSYDFLLDVRDALASVTGRHGHVLRIQTHDDVARALGIDGSNPADELLARVSRAARVVRAAYETTVAKARRNLVREPVKPRLVRGRRRRPILDEIAPGIALLSGELVLTGRTDGPRALLDLAHASATVGAPIHQATLLAMKDRDAARPLREATWPRWARERLEGILATGPAQIPVWEQFDLVDFIVDLIPAWAYVRNLPQRSAVHRHTVDRHQLEAVSRLKGLTARSGAGLSSLAPARRSALLLATLLHDIGKRPGLSGHSERGAEMVEGILAPMGYPAQVRVEAAQLVRHHLLLNRLVTSADPNDPATARSIAEAVFRDLRLLDCLHLLTQADASACKAEAWDSWRACLVANLVRRAELLLA